MHNNVCSDFLYKYIKCSQIVEESLPGNIEIIKYLILNDY